MAASTIARSHELSSLLCFGLPIGIRWLTGPCLFPAWQLLVTVRRRHIFDWMAVETEAPIEEAGTARRFWRF